MGFKFLLQVLVCTFIAFPVSTTVGRTDGAKYILWRDQVTPDNDPDSDVVDDLDLTLLVDVL